MMVLAISYNETPYFDSSNREKTTRPSSFPYIVSKTSELFVYWNETIKKEQTKLATGRKAEKNQAAVGGSNLLRACRINSALGNVSPTSGFLPTGKKFNRNTGNCNWIQRVWPTQRPVRGVSFESAYIRITELFFFYETLKETWIHIHKRSAYATSWRKSRLTNFPNFLRLRDEPHNEKFVGWDFFCALFCGNLLLSFAIFAGHNFYEFPRNAA